MFYQFTILEKIEIEIKLIIVFVI